MGSIWVDEFTLKVLDNRAIKILDLFDEEYKVEDGNIIYERVWESNKDNHGLLDLLIEEGYLKILSEVEL